MTDRPDGKQSNKYRFCSITGHFRPVFSAHDIPECRLAHSGRAVHFDYIAASNPASRRLSALLSPSAGVGIVAAMIFTAATAVAATVITVSMVAQRSIVIGRADTTQERVEPRQTRRYGCCAGVICSEAPQSLRGAEGWKSVCYQTSAGN